MAQSVRPATLIQGVVGLNPAAVISSVLPQGWGVGSLTRSQRHKGQADSNIKLGSVRALGVSVQKC